MKDLLDHLDLLVLLVRGAQLELLDLWDLLEDPVHKGLLDQQERREFREKKDLLGQRVGTEFKDRLVCLALPDRQECLGRMAIRARLENMVRRVPREEKESMVLLVHLVQWGLLVSLVLLVQMENSDRGASRGLLEPKVMKALGDSQGLLDRSDSRDFLGLLVRREKQAMLGLWVHQALPDLAALLVPTEPTVLKVLLVVWAILDLWERRESLVKLDHLVSEESLERRVLVESAGRRERLDNLELLEKLE